MSDMLIVALTFLAVMGVLVAVLWGYLEVVR